MPPDPEEREEEARASVSCAPPPHPRPSCDFVVRRRVLGQTLLQPLTGAQRVRLHREGRQQLLPQLAFLTGLRRTQTTFGADALQLGGFRSRRPPSSVDVDCRIGARRSEIEAHARRAPLRVGEGSLLLPFTTARHPVGQHVDGFLGISSVLERSRRGSR